MKALILAAGLGTRLKPLTDKIPKCMIKIAGKPVLEHIADYLNEQGVTEIVVNLHYMPDKIMKYFGNRFLYSYEPKLLGEIGAIKSLSSWLRDDYFFVVNGDTITNIDLLDMLKRKVVDLSSTVAAYMDGNVCAGTWLFAPEFIREGSWPGKMEQLPVSKYYDPDSYWVDMGTPEGLKKAREILEGKNASGDSGKWKNR